MKRIDDRTVEFTHPAEDAAVELFNQYLDDGMNVPLAAKHALNRACFAFGHHVFALGFVQWLGDGTVRRWGDRYIVRPQWRLVK